MVMDREISMLVAGKSVTYLLCTSILSFSFFICCNNRCLSGLRLIDVAGKKKMFFHAVQFFWICVSLVQ